MATGRSCVPLLTAEAPEGLVDDTLRYEIDKGEMSEDPGLFGNLPRVTFIL